MIEKIEQLISEKIRPVLAEHNGDISLVSFEEGIVKVRMLGQCAGCPSAMITTEEVIKKELMDTFPEIKDVFVVQESSPELIAFAKQLMGRNRK
ncbi:MAG: NifU family protein [Agathobacter sp.]|nr:NifU family protein [Agathobacter sp.]